MFRLLWAVAFLLWLALPAHPQPPQARQALPAGAILRLPHEVAPNEGKVHDAAYSPDGNMIATAAEGRVNVAGRVTLWDAATGRELWRVKTGHHTVPCRIAFASDGKTLAGCGNFGFLRFWDVASGKERSMDNRALGHLWAVAFCHNGKYLATGSAFGSLSLWDGKTGTYLGALATDRSVGGPITHVAFAADDQILVSTHPHGSLFWDLATRRPVRDFRIAGQGLMNPTFSPDGAFLAARDASHAVHLIRWETGKEVRTFAGVNAPGGEVGVYTWAFSPDGHSIALAQWNVPTVLLYEIATGRERARFVGHTDRVGTLSFAPHGRTLVSASLDRSALVWDVTGRWDGKWLAPKLGEAELTCLWSELASDQADRAYRAVWALALSPRQSVPFLEGKFFPKQAARLIAELEDDLAVVRDQAFVKLKELGPLAVSALRRANPRLGEAQARIQNLLDPQRAGKMSPSRRLQLTRALEALELAASPLARRVFEHLAGEDWSDAEARAALKRLASRRGD